jgi:hypothetical protein
MQTFIYTEDSGTVDEDQANNALTYYQGSFRSVRILADKIKPYTETFVRILSDNRGLINGHDEIDPEYDPDILWEDTLADAETQLLEDIKQADAIAFLLTRETFSQIISENWNRLVDISNPDTLWCISTTPKQLNSIDTSVLENRGDMVLIYERLGVSPIDVETREDFIKQVQLLHREALE